MMIYFVIQWKKYGSDEPLPDHVMQVYTFFTK